MSFDLFIAVVAFYFTVTTVKSQAVDCTALANAGDCDFYTQCVEPRFQCGTVLGYPLAYGDRYCRQFDAESGCFTSEGQVWIRNTTICLMKAILNSQIYQLNGTCAELETFAFESHPTCYADNGFCSDILLNYTNLHCMVSNVFQWTDFFNRQSIQQVYEAATRCTRLQADEFLSLVDGWISRSVGLITSEFLQTLKDLLGGCRYGLDIMLLLDSSGSIGSTNFATMRNFIANQLIPNFNIGADDTQVGVIRFSRTASTLIPLGSINNATLLENAIRNIIYTGGGTRTDLALNLTISAFSDARASEGIPRVVIVFTDGRSNEPALTVEAAQLVHDAGISVYSFGIGSGIDMTELNTIASNARNVFQIASFSITEFTNILLQLETSACTTPAIAFISEPLETTLERSESRLLEYPFPAEEGMTLKIDVTTGEVEVLGSFTIRNPTSLTADFSVRSSGRDGIDYYISPDLYQSSTGTMTGTDSNGRRQRRQADPQLSNNVTIDANVYLAILGLLDNNTFSLNTTFGDTSSAALGLKTVYQIPLFAVLFALMTLLLQ